MVLLFVALASEDACTPNGKLSTTEGEIEPTKRGTRRWIAVSMPFANGLAGLALREP
jgi:hypothetical protein